MLRKARPAKAGHVLQSVNQPFNFGVKTMSTVQAIFTKRETHTVKFFGGTPSKEITKAMQAAGFTYDGKSRQWYQSDSSEQVLSEEGIAGIFQPR
jgi:hypothetical protein